MRKSLRQAHHAALPEAVLYGIVDPGNANGEVVRVKGVVEKPAAGEAPSRLAIIGRYVLTQDIFARLSSLPRRVGGEVQLTDALEAAMHDTPLYAYRHDGACYDCGRPEGFIEANVAFGMEHADLAGHLSTGLRRRLTTSP